jgi:hypothetical protein
VNAAILYILVYDSKTNSDNCREEQIDFIIFTAVVWIGKSLDNYLICQEGDAVEKE